MEGIFKVNTPRFENEYYVPKLKSSMRFFYLLAEKAETSSSWSKTVPGPVLFLAARPRQNCPSHFLFKTHCLISVLSRRMSKPPFTSPSARCALGSSTPKRPSPPLQRPLKRRCRPLAASRAATHRGADPGSRTDEAPYNWPPRVQVAPHLQKKANMIERRGGRKAGGE